MRGVSLVQRLLLPSPRHHPILRQTVVSYILCFERLWLTKACLPLGFAFAFDFDEEPFLAGILEASESRSILIESAESKLELVQHTGHLPQLLVSFIQCDK